MGPRAAADTFFAVQTRMSDSEYDLVDFLIMALMKTRIDAKEAREREKLDLARLQRSLDACNQRIDRLAQQLLEPDHVYSPRTPERR